MTLSSEAIEVGVARLEELVRAEPALRGELEESEPAFFGGAAAADFGEAAPLARRRHLEWFLLERPSEHLGGVPAEALLDRLADAGVGGDQAEAFLNSRAGVFEITGVREGSGVWLRDLLGRGEFPVEEQQAAAELAEGDLVVGRLFPVGDTLYRLSPAASLFRNPALVEALRRDMETLRAGRRGTLRIAQSELERMFFAPSAPAPAPVDPATAARVAADALAAAGAPRPLAEELVAELAARAAGRPHGDAVTEALNRLAFDTKVDLEVARRELLALWASLRGTSESAAAPPAPRAERRGTSDVGLPRELVEDALARFDEGRAQGADLEQLFRALESDLGLESEDDPDDATAPDFPGVVGAMVEEFLWEAGREEGEDAARRLEPVRALGEFAAGVGVLEDLGRPHLLDFAARWALDSGRARTPEDARALLLALGAFCRWCEERQGVALWTAFGETLRALETSVPRLVAARERAPGSPTEPATLYELRREAGGTPVLVDAEDEPHRVTLETELDARLEPGDLVLARLEPGGRARVCACYPAELAELRRG